MPPCISALQRLGLVSIATLLITDALPLNCAEEDGTCSFHEVLPVRGEALLQHATKREQHAAPASHGAIVALQRHAARREGHKLPAGAKELFNEKLCKVKPVAKSSHNEQKTISSSSSSDMSSSEGSDSVHPSEHTDSSESSQDPGMPQQGHRSNSNSARQASKDSSKTPSEPEQEPEQDLEQEPEQDLEQEPDQDAERPISSLNSARQAGKNSSKTFSARNGRASKKNKSEPLKTQPTSRGEQDASDKARSSPVNMPSHDSAEDAQTKQELDEATHPVPMSREFLEEWSSGDTKSIDVGLDEEGFQKVADLHDEAEMKIYIRRVAESCNMTVIDDGGLNGLSDWMTGDGEEDASFEKLKESLFSALLAASPDHWVAVKNSSRSLSGSTASLDFVGFAQVRSLRNVKEMIKYIRRMVANMGVRIIDNGGFTGLLRFYTEPDDSGSFEKLMSEIKKAVYEHTWAELE